MENKEKDFKFKSLKIPPGNKMLEKFEDLFKLVKKKIKFKSINDEFFEEFKKFVVDINNSNKMWIKADKSRNLYKIDPIQYKKISNKITEKYKLDQNNIIDQINKDTYNFTNKLNIKNKIGKLNRKIAYIIFKDCK